MQSSNPALAIVGRQAGTYNFGSEDAVATVQGTTTKSLLLVGATMLSGWFAMNYTINQIYQGSFSQGLLMVSIIAALIVAVITCFKPQYAPVTAPLYAVCEGVGLGMLSGVMEFQYPGIVSSAVLATFVVLMVMLGLWKFQVIKVTDTFRSVVTGATLGVCVLYLLDLVLHLFGVNLLPQTGMLSVGVSVVVCGIAALNLILDFQNISNAVEAGLPRHFEYFNAFSLLVTICWLYIEILRLLARMRE